MSSDGWTDEMRSAYLYRVLAEVERDTPRARLFSALAGEAESQARIWARQTSDRGVAPPSDYAPDLRTRLVAWLARRLGTRAMRAVLAAMKVRGLSVYSHAVPGHPIPRSIEEMKARHRSVATGGSLRAAVFGVNDGLLSNCSLILGVAGASAATTDTRFLLLSGVAGLAAGAFSMAAGEYVSVRSQREMFEHQIGLERKELATYPREEAQELALIYAARGMSQVDAARLAERTVADPDNALDTLAREELGLNPDDLGSPWSAAASSFLAFALGALVPLLPFIFVRSGNALTLTIALTGCALFVVGALTSLFTGRNAFVSGLRMALIGAGAGALTFGIGKLLGVSLA